MFGSRNKLYNQNQDKQNVSKLNVNRCLGITDVWLLNELNRVSAKSSFLIPQYSMSIDSLKDTQGFGENHIHVTHQIYRNF